MNDFLKLAEDLGWSYNVSDTPNERGEVCVELEKYSPQGQDFIATIWFGNENEHNFVKALREYWQDFDPDEEACKWIGEDGHGKNGAPYSIRDILDDMEDCKGMLRKLYVAFHNTKPTQTIRSGNTTKALHLMTMSIILPTMNGVRYTAFSHQSTMFVHSHPASQTAAATITFVWKSKKWRTDSWSKFAINLSRDSLADKPNKTAISCSGFSNH